MSPRADGLPARSTAAITLQPRSHSDHRATTGERRPADPMGKTIPVPPPSPGMRTPADFPYREHTLTPHFVHHSAPGLACVVFLIARFRELRKRMYYLRRAVLRPDLVPSPRPRGLLGSGTRVRMTT